MDNELKFEDGQITLGGSLLPGVLVSLTVGVEIQFSDAKEDGQSGKTKVALGWTDADVTAVVDLLTDDTSDCYTKLRGLDRTFKGHGTGGRPQVYEVRNRHTLARNMKKVVFNRLESAETDQDDTIRCTLSFQEYMPAITKTETEKATSKTTPKVSTKAKNPTLDDSFAVNVK